MNHSGNSLKLIRDGSRLDRWLDKQFGSTMFSYRKIFSMLSPLILDSMFVFVIGLLTSAMISTSGSDSFAAVSLVSPLYSMIYAVYNAISAGGTVVVAQFKGKGEQDRINYAAGQMILATPLSAVISCILLIVAANPLLHLLFSGTDENVLIKAKQYLIGMAISMIFLAIYLGVFAVLRGIGETKLCLRLSMLINLLHFGGSFVFINIMKLDILGSVLSLNLARAVGGLAALITLLHFNDELNVKAKHIFHFDGPILRETFRIGIPYGLEQLCMSGGTMLVQVFVAWLGTNDVYANATSNSIVSLLYATPMAVGTLAITVVGQCIGAGNIALAKRYGKSMIRLGTYMVLLSLLVFLPLLPFILKMFNAPAEATKTIYILILLSSAMMPLFWSVSNNMPCVMRAAGDVTFSSFFSLITMWLIRVGLGYVFTITLGWGLIGLWLCMCLEWAVRYVVFKLRFRSDIWLRRAKENQECPAE